jgi:hypothetical protein
VDHPRPALEFRKPSIRRVPSRWMPRLKEGGIVGRSPEKGNARPTQTATGRPATGAVCVDATGGSSARGARHDNRSIRRGPRGRWRRTVLPRYDPNHDAAGLCRRIANVKLRSQIEAVCQAAGYEPPLICTPEELPARRLEDK